MQQQAIQHLDDAVSEVFALMLNRDCRPVPCTQSRCPDAPPNISAAISFSGALSGVCRIHLALSTAAIITAELLGAEPDPASALNADTTGELCNMIAGSWKSRQPIHGDACISSPSIVIRHLVSTATASTCSNLIARNYRFEDLCLRLEMELTPP